MADFVYRIELLDICQDRQTRTYKELINEAKQRRKELREQFPEIPRFLKADFDKALKFIRKEGYLEQTGNVYISTRKLSELAERMMMSTG